MEEDKTEGEKEMSTYEEYVQAIEELLAKGKENWTTEDGMNFHSYSYKASVILQQKESKDQ